MSNRTPRLLLEDIVESAEKIIEYTKSISFEDFSNDNKTIDAVIRNFEIIGEASILLPDEIKEKYSHIDWRRIRGFTSLKTLFTSVFIKNFTLRTTSTYGKNYNTSSPII